MWEFGKCLLTPVSKLLSGLFIELHQVLKVCKRNSVQSPLETRKTSLSPQRRWGILPFQWDRSSVSEGFILLKEYAVKQPVLVVTMWEWVCLSSLLNIYRCATKVSHFVHLQMPLTRRNFSESGYSSSSIEERSGMFWLTKKVIIPFLEIYLDICMCQDVCLFQ